MKNSNENMKKKYYHQILKISIYLLFNFKNKYNFFYSYNF